MKIAILLLAHKNKAQLERLISVLRNDHVDIFVHLDLKADFFPSDINAQDIVFTEKRIDVGLFEFSMIEAEFELINTARRYGNYSYFILMSAQCYPIRSMRYIYEFLESHYPEPFIEIVAPKDDNYVKVNFEHTYIFKRLKLRTYAFLKEHFSFKGYRALRYIPGGMIFVASRIKEFLVGSPKANLKKLNLPTYCGSQWWILPDNMIERAIHFYENKDFCRTVSDTFSCDETFFQVVVMSDPDAAGVELDTERNYINRKWFYIFDNGHPIVFTKEYYDQIIASRMFFARKFDIDTDSEVLDMIDVARETDDRLDT